MAQTKRNRGRTWHDGAAPRDSDPNTGSIWIHAPSSDGGDAQGLSCRLRRMYRDIAEEPLPETFNALVRRLRGSNTTNNGNNNGNGSQ